MSGTLAARASLPVSPCWWRREVRRSKAPLLRRAAIAFVLCGALAACGHPWNVQTRAAIHGLAVGVVVWDHATAAALRAEATGATAEQYREIDARYSAQAEAIRATATTLRTAESFVLRAEAGELDKCNVLPVVQGLADDVRRQITQGTAERQVRLPIEVTVGFAALSTALQVLTRDCAARNEGISQ